MEVKEMMKIDEAYTPDALYDEDDTIIEGEDSDFGGEWTESSVADGMGTDDTMKMYLREIGKIRLLSADEERVKKT